MKEQEKILIVGAGLCGCLLAIRLAQRGYKVSLVERRPDMRKEDMAAGRSINLALSARGLKALDKVGLKEQVLAYCIPMRGRMIHAEGMEARLSPYSGRKEDYINSVSRSGLNIALLDAASAHQNIDLKFSNKCIRIELEEGIGRFKNELTGEIWEEQADLVIGTDGAGSAVRRSMMAHTTKLLFNYSQDFLRHGYKELSIDPAADGGYKIEKNALHIWPRGDHMIIALANLDGSFTVTMFHPFKGKHGFDTLKTPEKLQTYFQKEYPELLPHISDLEKEYFENSTGTLGTIKCYPWHAYAKTLIMGDASHAIVPFYGQGMNAALEDVYVFDEILDKYAGNWEEVLEKFQDARVENANAIADLALDNFYEMSDHVDDNNFMKKRKLEVQLEQTYEDYYAKYSLVTFLPDLPYAAAMKLGRAQDKLLLEICAETDFDKIVLEDVYQRLKKLKKEVLG